MDIQSDQLLLARTYHWEATTPDKVFMTQPIGGGEVRQYTWREAIGEARRMAAHLRGLNFPAKSKVALLGKNSAHWILTDLAIWMAGHVTVPLYPTLTADSVRQLLEHSESKLLFVGKLDDWDQMKGGVPQGMPQISLPLSPPDSGAKWEQIAAESEPITDNPQREPQDLATIVYTSGTTGKPKGVMLSFGAMGLTARELCKMTNMSPQDRTLSYLPLAHVYERVGVEGLTLNGGGEIFFAESLHTFVADLQRARPTVFASVPRLWLKFQAGVFAKVPPEKLERLLSIPILSSLVRKKILKGLGLQDTRLAICAAAPVPAEVLRWYRRLGLELLEGYGMSENCAYSHFAPAGKGKVGYVGTANPGVETRISDEGELLVKSPGMMMGYYKEPGLTTEAITADGFLRTGDMGDIDSEGYLRITGRVKELFKTSKGKYVAPSPIENQLISHPYIEQACVIGSGFPQPSGLIMLSEEARALTAGEEGRGKIEDAMGALLKRVNENLDHHERLQYLALVQEEWGIDNGMITPTMKIKRAAIEETYGPHFESWYGANAPVLWQSA
ncbi:MAG: AMP-binding protein [SAR324 cluster bacterium]|nr:AMP-binding protein [SAR324 cluster bacterium]